jgi:hypothetical protein
VVDHLEPALLEQLVVEFRDHGQRAVEFLQTARDLVERGLDRSPRSPEVVAYCLREALKAIPASQDRGEGGEWKRLSRQVVDARRRYDIASAGLPGQDPDAELARLLRLVDDLDEFHKSEGIHQARLIAVIVDRTGTIPYESGSELIRRYQVVLEQLDHGVHGTVGAASVMELYDESVGLLRRLFTPPGVRNADLEALAGLAVPADDDLARLRQLVVTRQHLHHFLSQLASPAWLTLLSETRFVDPPSGEGPWPGLAAVKSLSPTHADEVAGWLTKLYDRCGRDPVRAWHLARAAFDAGPPGRHLIVRAVRDHPRSVGVWTLGYQLLRNTDPADPIVEDVADVMLNATGDDPWLIEQIAEWVVDGISADNALSRLKLIGYKLRAIDQSDLDWQLFTIDRSGSIGSWTRTGPSHRFDVLLRAWTAAAEVVRRLHGTERVLTVADTLPVELGGRARAWILGTDPDVPMIDLVAELASTIAERKPTGDDLELIDRVIEGCDEEQYRQPWSDALGPAPTIAEVGRALAEHESEPGWTRAHLWLSLLPESVQGAWANAYALMCGAYGTPQRSGLESRPLIEAAWGRSPYSAEELRAMEPLDAAAQVAAWRPDPAQFLVGARELGRAVEQAVEEDPVRWLDHPIQMATRLHEPIYISHYLRGAAKVVADVTDLPIDDFLNVVVMVRSHPWQPVSLGHRDFDYDPDWRQADAAAVDFLRALADKHLGFASRDDDVWDIIRTSVLNRADASGLPDETDPLNSAINRPCTQALQAALSFMAHEYQCSGGIRPAAFDLLDEMLHLEGFDGAQHRAIIASRVGFFTTVAADWVDARLDLLFGTEAPGDLGQLTVDLAIRWSRPNRLLLERRRPAVWDAATRDVDNAVDHMLVANLWAIPGYSTDELVGFFTTVPGLLSSAGEAFGRLARHADDPRHLAAAMRFWQVAIDFDTQESRSGFGWFAEASGIDDELWAELTLGTLQTSAGAIDWTYRVAERAHAMAPSTATLAIFDELVRHSAHDWDRRRASELAVEHIRQAQALAATPEYQRLYTTLLERGLL